MKYLALIYADESLDKDATPAQQKAVIDEYGVYEGWLATKPGKRLGGEALLPTSTAKTIRIRDGKTTITDGPFAETKEHLGGFYLLEADSLEEAIELAQAIPSAKVGCVEVRPIMTFD